MNLCPTTRGKESPHSGFRRFQVGARHTHTHSVAVDCPRLWMCAEVWLWFSCDIGVQFWFVDFENSFIRRVSTEQWFSGFFVLICFVLSCLV
jgi:hypothetical protein